MARKAKIMPRGSRYGPFLSVGELLGARSRGLKDTVKVQFLPQWERRGTTVDVALSKRFLLLDLGMTELTQRDTRAARTAAANLAKALSDDPDALLKIANAFGHAGSRRDRVEIQRRAEELGLAGTGGTGPVAIWGVILAIGAAILLAGCCNETDTDCGSNGTDTDDDKAGGGSGGGTGGSSGTG